MHTDDNARINERRFNLHANNDPQNVASMALACILAGHGGFMKTYANLYPTLCSSENIYLAWKKARKGRTLKNYVVEFGSDL